MSNLDNLKIMMQGMHNGVAPSDAAVSDALLGGIPNVADEVIAQITGKARADLTDDDKAAVVCAVTRAQFNQAIISGVQNASLQRAGEQAQAAGQQAAADLA